MRTGSRAFFSSAACIAAIANSLALTRSSPPCLAFSQYYELGGGELLCAHRAVGVEPGGGDADLGTQPELAAVGEAGRGVDHHRGRVDLVDEAVGRLGIAGDDGFSVIGAPALDVA